MAEIWAAAAAIVGTGAALYGANKQSKDNKAAQATNASLQQDQNRMAWSNYLMSRGMAPTSPVEPGVLPQEGQYRSVSTRLPLWATVNMPATVPTPPKRSGFLVPKT